MAHSPAGASGRPTGAAGPLASLLVAVLTTVGLGCATTAASATPGSELGLGVDRTSVGTQEVSSAGVSLLELRRSIRTEPSPPTTPARTRQASRIAAPQPPVIDARPRPAASTRQTRPVRIRVSAADLDVKVQATGVAGDGSMELPDTVRRAGWYRYSAVPGSRTGSTVVAAHVDTRTEGLGPFARLAGLRKRDRIVLTDRSGADHTYSVEVIRRVTRTKLPVDDLFDREGPPRLVLITCGGAYDARNGYHDNVVVLAEPDP